MNDKLVEFGEVKSSVFIKDTIQFDDSIIDDINKVIEGKVNEWNTFNFAFDVYMIVSYNNPFDFWNNAEDDLRKINEVIKRILINFYQEPIPMKDD